VIRDLLSKYNLADESTNLTDGLGAKEEKQVPGMKRRKGC